MGLDHGLMRKCINPVEMALDKLEGKEKIEELLLWRKAYTIQDWFYAHFDCDNCKNTTLTKEDLIAFVEFLQEYKDTNTEWGNDREYYTKQHYKKWILDVTKIIEETDFENYEVFYWNWY
jgi:hypothetical protein